jgi:hypothetical protein
MSASDLVTHLGIIIIALLLIAPGVSTRSEAAGIGTTICFLGAGGTAVVAAIAYVFARKRGQAAAPRLGIREWIVKRGILYVLTQAPVIGIFCGFFFRIVPFGTAAIGEIVAFYVLFTWVAHRKGVSIDPDEPVHQLAQYTIWALVPCVAFSLARIPTHLGFGFAYWHPWYDFGSELSGLPSNQYPALLAGALLYTLDGLVLALGYYILFQHRSLTNAIIYIGLYISSIYCFTFPAYVRIGMKSPPVWHVVVFWAHIAMAVAAWYMPRFFERTWPRLGLRARGASIAVIGVALAGPYAYAAFQSSALQWPKQHAIDAELFARRDLLAATDRAAIAVIGHEVRYDLAMQLGPRSYKNWVNRLRVVDVQRVEVDGRLIRDGRPIAWCTSYTAELPRINDDAHEPNFAARVRAHDIAELPVRCVGPSAAVGKEGDAELVSFEWRASATLIGDRESVERTFAGSRRLRLVWPATITAADPR